MALLNLKNVSLGYEDKPLLENVNLTIEKGQRLCLLGRNGCGKSTLLKFLNGDITSLSGQTFRQSGLKTAMLSQQVPKNIRGKVVDVVTSGLGSIGALISDYYSLAHQLSEDPDNTGLLKRLENAGHEIETNSAWKQERNVEAVITNLNLNPDLEFSTLSAGNKRRVLLGRCLVSAPDILILDEPTNHLDINSIDWLEEFLLNYKGTVIFVTHDRTFLKKLATSIIDIDLGEVKVFDSSYEKYLENKQQLLDAAEKHKQQFEKKLAEEEIWIRQGVRERRKRDMGRVRSLLQMREEKRQRKQRLGKVKMNIQQADLSGKRVIKAENISFAYPSLTIVKDFSIDIMRGDKIGIIGPNGCGKTTLINLLLKKLHPQSGSVEHGTNLQISYFDQLHAQLNLEKSVYENITYGTDHVTINGVKRNVFGYLQDFLFTPDRARTSVSSLSGGERNRLLLARLFSQPCNLLILDEPTNDLDLETMQLLEEQLLDFQGTVIMVSHDRSFLDNVVTSSLLFEENGKITEYVGGYTELMQEKREAELAVEAKEPKPKQKQKIPQKPGTGKKKKLSYRQQQELNELPQSIEKAEEKISQLHEKLADPDLYRQQGDKIASIKDELAQTESLLEKLYTRWEELEELK